jgi:hypothetical protein
MSKVAFNDWRAENEQRNYPFADDATLEGSSLSLAKALFIDGRLYPIGGDETLYLGQVSRSGSTITFTISTETAGALATGSYDVADIPASGEIAFHDSYGRPAGMLLSSETALQAFSGLNSGDYTFLPAEARFATAVVVPQPDTCFRGFILPDGELVTGDVWIVGEDGVVIRNDDGALRVDMIGDPFATRKLCEDEEPSDDTIEALAPYCPLKTVNGIEPDENGNFQLLIGSNQSMSNILRIMPVGSASSDVTKHLDGEGALRFATLKIEALGQRRLRGDL